MKTVNAFVGQPIERLEDLRLVRGRGQYVDDLARAGMLHAAILRSHVAHGRIRNIDISRAQKIPGVHAVITAADLGDSIPLVPMRLQPMPEFEAFGQPVMAHDKVRYVGEALAMVLADSAAVAEDALSAIEVDIESLPALANWQSASKNETLLFEHKGSNTTMKFRAVLGDAAAAFKDAPYTRRETFSTQRHTALPMEPRGLLAEWDAANGRLTVSGAAKVLFANRRILAKQLGLPVDAIDMVEYDVGGSFGARGEFYPEDFLIPFAARHLGRPVKWTEDRREHLMTMNHAREAACEVEIACTREGKVLGLRGHAFVDMGAYMRTNGAVGARNIAQFMSGPYRIPNIDLDTTLLLTNKTPVGTYRGPGRFETDFFRERLFDMAARDLGIDPVEFRRRNLVAEGEMPYKVATIAPFESKDELDSGDYQVTLDRCLAEFSWAEKQKLKGKLIDGRYHGLAICCFIEGGAAGPKESARLQLETDGTLTVYMGSSGVGQGLETAFAQIAADAMDMPMDRINNVFHGSTTYVSDGYGSYHSRSIVMGGSAVLDAATKLRQAMSAEAARAAQLRRRRSIARRRPRHRARRQVGVMGGIGAGAALGRRRILQSQAHLGLWRSCRARYGRSQNRPRRIARLCRRGELRPDDQSVDAQGPARRRHRARPRRHIHGTSSLRRARPVADRLARRLSGADRERFSNNPRLCDGVPSVADQSARRQGRRRGRHHLGRRRDR